MLAATTLNPPHGRYNSITKYMAAVADPVAIIIITTRAPLNGATRPMVKKLYTTERPIPNIKSPKNLY